MGQGRGSIVTGGSLVPLTMGLSSGITAKQGAS